MIQKFWSGAGNYGTCAATYNERGQLDNYFGYISKDFEKYIKENIFF